MKITPTLLTPVTASPQDGQALRRQAAPTVQPDLSRGDSPRSGNVPKVPVFRPILPEEMNMRGMTRRALEMSVGSRIDILV